MQEPSDIELLRQYTGQNSEEAFAALVSRHVNLVYSAALRKTGNCHVAQEITQAVFIILAKKAPGLRKETILPGWLYQTARLTAANFLRNDMRRIHREQEACMQSPNEPEPWPQIVPLLEDAMGRLSEKERNAIVLRFFEGKSFQEIGTAFGASENAAKKRVSHGLEKLRKFLFRRGVNSTPEAIAGAISANSIALAPSGLAKTISVVAVAKGAAASASTLILVKGALQIMAWSNAKTAAVAGVAAVVLVAATTVVIKTSNTQPHRAVTASPDSSLFGTDSIPQIQLGDALNVGNRVLVNTANKARIAKLRAEVWPKEKQLMEEKIAAGQQKDDTTNTVRIDLTPYINAKLTDSPVSKGNNFARLPLGVHIFGGVPFDVEGAIYLMGGWRAHEGKSWPEEVDNIHIGSRCAKIDLFHGESYIFYWMYGTAVAKLILHYEDGSTNELDMVAGQQAIDFWSPLFSTGVSPANLQTEPGTVAAWTGTNPLIHQLQPDESLVLFRTTFKNPHPDLMLASVDYVSNKTMTIPMLFGLTLEQ